MQNAPRQMESDPTFHPGYSPRHDAFPLETHDDAFPLETRDDALPPETDDSGKPVPSSPVGAPAKHPFIDTRFVDTRSLV